MQVEAEIVNLNQRLADILEHLNGQQLAQNQAHLQALEDLAHEIGKNATAVAACRICLGALIDSHPAPDQFRASLRERLRRVHAATTPEMTEGMFAIEAFLDEFLEQAR